MADIPVQELPANGKELAVSFAAANLAGDSFTNDGQTTFKVQWGATPSGNVVLEGVEAPDSGRDGTVTLTAGAANSVTEAGPFKTRNFNNGGKIEVTYPSGVTDINVAAVKHGIG